MIWPHRYGLLPPPERIDAVRAVGKMIGLIRRRYTLTAKAIAEELPKNGDKESVDDSTVSRWEGGGSLPSALRLLQLLYMFPEAAEPIIDLIRPQASEPTTLHDRLERAEQEILIVRRELEAAGKGDAA